MRYEQQNYSPNTQFTVFPPAIKHLIIINALFFVGLTTPYIGNFLYRFGALWPLGSGFFWPWQLISYLFLHGGVGHIFFNLFALWMFGQAIENLWGTRRFAVYYFITGIGAGIIQLLIESGAPTIGASGAVFGILLAFGMMFPERPILLLFFPFPIKAKYFVAIFGVIQLLNGIRGGSNVAYFAHLGGMVFGYGLIQYWRYKGELY